MRRSLNGGAVSLLVMMTVAVAHCNGGVVGKNCQETAWEVGRTNKPPAATISKFMKNMRRKHCRWGIESLYMIGPDRQFSESIQEI